MDSLSDPVADLRDEDLTEPQRDAIDDLTRRVFFPEGTQWFIGPKVMDGVALTSPRMRIIGFDGRVYDKPPLTGESPRTNHRHFVLWGDEGEAIAHAAFFDRTILTEEGPRLIAALAAVCVDRTLHGRGMGRRVVAAALDVVVSGPWRGCLFQTGVPGFYEKLGCHRVDNRFVNRATALDPDATPWWDRHVMIHPAGLDWPAGEIDLNGGGF